MIKKMGGTPKADIKLPEIEATADNLRAALEGETYEKDKMYKVAKTFYVCPVCGKTVLATDFSKCPMCFTPADRYIKVV